MQKARTDLLGDVTTEIHIWPVLLSADANDIAVCECLLDEEEAATAARRSGDVRQKYVLSHAVLRQICSAYSDLPPSEVRYTLGRNGKPRLQEMPASFHFNVSHSGNIALYAIARACEIGVDVEQIRPFDDMHAISRQYFCPEEAAELEGLPEPQRAPAFFRCWTRKEAYIKAKGEGLSIPLDAFRVTLLADDAPRIVHIGGSRSEASAWTMHELHSAPGYAAALAYRDSARPLRVFPLETAGMRIQQFRAACLV